MGIFTGIKHSNLSWIKQAGWLAGIVGLLTTIRIYFFNVDLLKNWVPDLSANQDLYVLLSMAGIYMILLSIPFLPGIELGLLLMCVADTKMIMVVYFFTVLGLTLSFLMGRWLPLQRLQFFLKKLSPGSMEYQEPHDNHFVNKKIEQLLGMRFTACIKKYPYLIVAVLLNLPGNFILGGGGGIAMLSGLNPRLSLKYFVLTVILATLPFPLLLFLGFIQLERFL